jgi:hypothetical protein
MQYFPPPWNSADQHSAQDLPFMIASVIILVLDSFAVLLAVSGITISSYFLAVGGHARFKRQNSLFLTAVLLQTVGLLAYFTCTVAFLHGGQYLHGFWISFVSTVLCILLGIVSFRAEKYHGGYIIIR